MESKITKEDLKVIANAFAEASANAKNKAVNNANEAALEINKKIKQKQVAQERYASKIAREMQEGKNCTTIIIPEIFKKYQPSFVASINGCTVKIPADGKPRVIHNDFAVVINRRMTRLSNNIARMSSPDISEYHNY